ncbi:MAG TPA: Xaa-Pro peptidase family protein [Thermoanaerobaculia bacterium]|nr:Xaa-Pro peptidase family protein [Thermoanaerobaculia bacterium]
MRASTLASGLAEMGCGGLVVFAESAADPDLAPFTGSVHLGESLLIVPAGGTPRLVYFTAMERDEAAATGLGLITPEELDLVRWRQEAPDPVDFLAGALTRALERAGLAPGRTALAGHGQVGVLHAVLSRLARTGWEWVPGNDLVLAVRKRKTGQEVAAIREAAAGTAEAFRTVARLLATAVPSEETGELQLGGTPLTVGRLRAEVAMALAARGLEQPRGNIIAPGDEGGVPHSAGTPERVVRLGEPLVVDIFPHGTLFADCTRTFCVGEPSEPLAAAYAAVREALERAYAAARPGVRGWDLQETVCQLFQERGYPTPISHPGTLTGYVHGLGHGVGFQLHEQPVFRKETGAEGVIAEGDVFTLEPGLYDPGAAGGGYGVRLEDLVWLGPDGLENLTPLPYDLDPRAW